MHHGRCPRLLAALDYAEQQQQQQLQVTASDNGGSVADFTAITPPLQSAVVTTMAAGNNSSNNGGGNLGIAPRASPEISEAEASTNMCHRLNVHRASSVSYNGNDNAVVGNVQVEASTVSPHVRYACENTRCIKDEWRN